MPAIQKKIIILDSVDSTNNYAMGMIQQREANDGIAVFAREQTNGKGSRGRHWISNKNENILVSVCKQMQWLPVSQQFGLSAAVALGCLDLMSKYLPEKINIKWPNDIFINDTKAGGILIENIIRGTLWQWAVIGIGININQTHFEDSALKATSLRIITGKAFDVLSLTTELCKMVLDRIGILEKGGFDTLLEAYNQNLFARGRIIKIQTAEGVFETMLSGVSPEGQLVTDDKIKRRFNFDEAKFIGLADAHEKE